MRWWGVALAIALLVLLVPVVSANTWKAIYTNNTLNTYMMSSSTTKTTAYNATTGTIRNYSPTTTKLIFVGTNETYSVSTTYYVMRGYLFFPTGNYIPMNANVSAANLSINISAKGTTSALHYLNISGNGSYIYNPGDQPFTSIAPPHYGISTRDYYRRNYIEDIDSSITTGGSPAQTLASKLRISAGSAEAYNNISITSDGRNLIRKGGSNVSAIVLRTTRDIWHQAQGSAARQYHFEIVSNKSVNVGVATSNNFYTPILWVYYHTPPDAVLYNTTLRKSGDSGETSVTGPINGSRPLQVVFCDYSSGDVNNTAYYWDSGDGNTLNVNESSAGACFNVKYDVPGVYTVGHNITAKDIDPSEPTRTQWNNLTDWVTVQNKNATIRWNLSANGVTPEVLYGNTTTKFYAVDRTLGTNLTDPISYYYNWTDGNVSVKQNATHIFPVKDEEYSLWNVTHNVTEDVGTPWQNVTWVNLTENQIRVFHNATPNMTFSADVTSGTVPFVVTFTATDIGHIKTDYWCWTFGDGGVSSGEQNPVHTYTSVGTYDVHLFAGNYTLGVGDTARVEYIEAEAGVTAPVAAWNATIYGIITNTSGYGLVNGTKDAKIQLVDESANTPTSWLWTLNTSGNVPFNSSTDQNWNAVIKVPGLYSVNFSATNEGGTGWFNRSDFILVQNVNATILWNISANGRDPEITYGNTSTNFYTVDKTSGTNLTDPGSYFWNWTDGNLTVKKNAIHKFPVGAEEYRYWEVAHNVTEDVRTPWQNTTWYNLTNVVRVFHNATPNVTASGNPLTGGTPLTVTFTTADVGHIKTDYWCWSYGDGGYNSGEQNPQHTYTSAGTYTVHLVAGNYTLGLTDNVLTNYVTASTAPVAAWNATIYGIQTNISGYGLVNGTKDAKIRLVEASANTPTSWLWTLNTSGNVPFNSSTSQNWNVVIKVPGLYSVNFSATNAAGTSWLNRSDFIIVSNINATILWNISANGRNPPTYYGNTTTLFYTVDRSLGTNLTDPGSYFWNWTDGNVTVKQNATHRFPVGDEEYRYWEVAHNVTEDVGTPWANTSWFNLTNIVRVFHNATPNVTLSADVTSGATPLTVTFTTTDVGHIKTDYWCWTYGDGGVSSGEQNPIHTYTSTGTYTVHVVAGNYTLGLTDFVRTNYITATTAPVAAWNATIYGIQANISDYGVVNGTKDAKIQLVEMSANTPTSWLWTLNTSGNVPFNSSTSQNWNVVIKVPGLYSVNFSATNAGGTSWLNRSNFIIVRNVNATILWNISANGKNPEVTYGNTSTSFYTVDKTSGTNLTDPGSYFWNWTDGNVTVKKNAIHKFPVGAEEYRYWEVAHNVTEDVGTPWANTTWYNLTNVVRVFHNATPNVTLTADVTSGNTPLTVTFTTTDIGHIKTDYWCWTYGDGGVNSGEQNPVHTYTSAGTYTVHVVAGNYTMGLTDFVRTNYITATTIPVAAWNATIYGLQVNMSGYGLINGTKDAKIQLIDMSANSPTSWLWTLNTSGNVPFNSSTSQNWNVVIKVPGLYSVNFSATNAAGTSWLNRSDLIIVRNKNATSIWNIGSNASFNKSTRAYFFDASTGTNVTGWYWTFGDGNWTTSQNGAHNYSVTGKYTVSLNATEDAGTPWQNITATVTRTAYVSIINNTPNLTFWSDVQSGATPLTVTFTEAHNQTVENYTWLFVTSTGSIEFTDRNQTPVYIFKNAGTYSVNYSVMNYENVVWFNRSAFITATTPPTTDFSCDRQSGTSHYDTFCEDSSTGSPTSYFWSVENGTSSMTSTVKNPIFNMTWGDLYNVNHSSTNAGGTDWENKTAYLLVYDAYPDIQWNKTPDRVANKSSTVYFVDWSTGSNITQFSWNFTDSSDGSTNSYKRNTTHVFSKWPWPNEYNEYEVEHNVTQSSGTPWNSTEWQNDTFLSSIRIYHNETPTSITLPSAFTGTRHLPVTWTNERVGHIEQDYWLWQLDLPDGDNTSTDENPLFIYERAGLYTATVYAGNYTLGNGSYTKYDEILVFNAPPTAAWSSIPILPKVINLSTGFTVSDSSSGTNISGPTAIKTYWGDGNWSYGSERTWYYNITTNLSYPYTINHSVSDSPGTPWILTDWENKTSLWVVNNTVNFTLEVVPTSGQRPLAVTPSLTSDGGRIMYCNYSWGDGNVTNGSTLNPTHTYDFPGDFTLNATCGNDAGQIDPSWAIRTVEKVIHVTSALPVADFSCTPRYGTVHFDVECTDLSINDPTAWMWRVENGSVPKTSLVKHPIFNMTWADMYNINLSVTNSGGNDWENKTGYIIANNTPPMIIWNGTPTTANLSTWVYFVDSSTGTNITAWNWSFGDGNVSSSQNITHKFPNTGVYDILHNATDSDKTMWNVTNGTLKAAYINIINNTPNLTFWSDVQSGYIPLTVTFTEAHNQTVENYTWLFVAADGTIEFTDRNQTPVYIFKTAGTYSVNYSVMNYENVVWFNRSAFITTDLPPAPVAAWNATIYDIQSNMSVYGLVNGTKNAKIHFVDMSANSPTSWLWTLNTSGNVPFNSSTDQDWNVVVTVPGLYSVNFSATNVGGTGWLNRSNLILVQNINATTIWNISAEGANPPILYGNTSTVFYTVDKSLGTNLTDPDSYFWNWTDGNLTVRRNATHRFPVGDEEYRYWEVAHNTSEDVGTPWQNTSWYNLTNIIRVFHNATPNVTFVADTTSGSTPLTVTFTATDVGHIKTDYWCWTYGDGEVSSGEQNPVHTYTSDGIYDVHIVSGNYTLGVTDTVRTGYITVTTALLNVDFNATPRYGTIPQQVVFVDLSTGGTGLSWSWDVDGDGTPDSTKQNYTHTYASAGAYTINHSATSSGGAAWENRSYYVIINNTPPIVAWNGTPTTVNLSTEVYFVDSSSSTNISTYNWSFGDGNVSNVRNPTHRYPDTGWYDVLHNVTDSYGTLWNVTNGTLETAYIHVINNTLTPNAFTCVPVSGNRPVSVTCTDATTGGAVMNYSWMFDNTTGGTNTSTQQNPTFIYDVVGTFSVNHSACNDAGCVWYNRSDYITITQFVPPTPPVADFSCTPRQGTVHLDTECTDISTNTPTSWVWTVENGTSQITSSVSHPIFNITWADMYSVNLQATNGDGSDWENKSEYLIVNNTEPVLNWVGAPLNTDTSTPVSFTDTSTGTNLTWYNWSFGDGSFKWAQSPTHLYTTTGTFTVTHNVTDSNNTMWNRSVGETRVNYVTVTSSPITPAFSCTPLSGPKPLTVSCIDESIGGPPTSWEWLFAENDTYNTQNTGHTFTDTGTWDVNFSACDAGVCVWLNKTGYIFSYPPGAGGGGTVNLTINITPPNATPITTEYRPLNDWRVWILFAVGAFAFLIVSHVSPRGNDLFAVLAIICSIIATWGSIGLAIYNEPIPYLSNQTLVNATYNGSITISENQMYYSAFYIGSPWLTLFFVVFSIVALLNLIYIYVEVVVPSSIPKQRGRRPPQQVGTQELPNIEVENGYYDEWGNHRTG